MITQGLKWVATITVIAAAFLFTVWPELGHQWWLLCMFLTGHCIWVIFTVIMREWALLTLNAAFIPIDLYGVLIRL